MDHRGLAGTVGCTFSSSKRPRSRGIPVLAICTPAFNSESVSLTPGPPGISSHSDLEQLHVGLNPHLPQVFVILVLQTTLRRLVLTPGARRSPCLWPKRPVQKEESRLTTGVVEWS